MWWETNAVLATTHGWLRVHKQLIMFASASNYVAFTIFLYLMQAYILRYVLCTSDEINIIFLKYIVFATERTVEGSVRVVLVGNVTSTTNFRKKEESLLGG